jgi:hypothetical protein
MESLAFRVPDGGCGLCGGAGSVPDPDRPAGRRPCPSCSARRPRAGRPRRDLPELTAGTVVWHALVLSFHVFAALFAVLLVTALWQAFTG